MQPSTLPGRSYVSVGSERKSRLLFHFRARAGAPLADCILTGQTPTFVRATAGGAVIDRNGRLRTPVHSQPRYEMVDLDGDGIRETAGLLIEPQVTQLCPNPQTPDSWTNFGTPTVTTGQPDPWGGSAAILIEDDDAGNSEGKAVNVPFTADGEKVAIFAVRAGTLSAIRCRVFDTTAAATRHDVVVTWNGGTAAPTVTTNAGSGSIFPSVGVFDTAGNLWWLIMISATGIIAANNNQVQAFSGPLGTGIGTFYFAGANAWNSALPTSWVATAATVRNADDLTSAIDFASFNANDDDLTLYVRLARPPHYDAAGALPTNPGLCLLSTTVPRIGIQYGASARQYLVNIDTAGTDAQASAPLPSGTGQEICAQFVDLAVGGKVRVDTGSGFGAFSSTATPITALGDATLRIGRYVAEYLGGVVLDFKLARGPLTLPQMRESF